MAINPETQYPGKINPSTGAYPFGSARNITVPGDGTGTPWEAALVNDIFGFQQALLTEVGAVPTGTPEEVGASQYLDAIFTALSQVFASVSNLTAKSLPAGRIVMTSGYNSSGDGGGAKYLIQTPAQFGGTPDEFGDHTLANGNIARLVHRGTIRALQYGAQDGIDSTAALNALKVRSAAEGSTMYLDDDKTFLVSSTIVPVSGWTMRGRGTLKLADGTDQRVIANDEAPVVELENIFFSDFTIDGNRANQTAATTNNDGIKLSFVENLFVDNIVVKSCGTPDAGATGSNNAVGLSLHECINFWVSRCDLKDCQHYNAQIWECVDGVVYSNISTDPGSHCFGGAANLRVKYIGNTGSIIWSRSSFTYDPLINAGQGMWFRQYQDCVISANTMYRQTDGVSLTPAGAGIQNGNEPSLTPTPQSPRLNGILVPNQSVTGTQIVGNTVTGNFEFGIYSFSGAIEITNTGNNTITGCWAAGLIVTSGRLLSNSDTVIECGGQGSGTDAAIWAAGRDHLISNPTVRDAGTRGIHVQGVRSTVDAPRIEGYGQLIQDYGIYVNDFSNDVIISDPQVYTDTPGTQSINGIYIGDDAARTNINGGNVHSQPTAATAIRPNNRTDHNVSNVIGYDLAAGNKYQLPQRNGNDYYWPDSAGRLRIKVGGAPANDTDGVIVGTQV